MEAPLKTSKLKRLKYPLIVIGVTSHDVDGCPCADMGME